MNKGYRLCTVDGKKAIFHKWIQKQSPIVIFPVATTKTMRSSMMSEFERKGYLPFDAKLEILTNVYALVEMEDGTIKEIEPEKLAFRDGGLIFRDLLKRNTAQISGAQRDVIDVFDSTSKNGQKRY